MNEKVINKQIKVIKDKLNSIISDDIEKLLNIINCSEMEQDIQKNIIDYINIVIEQCDVILENYYDGEYSNDDEEDSLFDD